MTWQLLQRFILQMILDAGGLRSTAYKVLAEFAAAEERGEITLSRAVPPGPNPYPAGEG